MEKLRPSNVEHAADIEELRRSLDDLENRDRRNHLLFFAFPDSQGEAKNEPESKVISLTSKSLHLHIDLSAIESAHRLGQFSEGKNRPVIVRFNHFKTEDAVLGSAYRLKRKLVYISEDFSQKVTNTRRTLTQFAKSANSKFRLRYDRMYMNGLCYVVDDSTGAARNTERSYYPNMT